jgi:hypothetical protein
MLVWFLQDKLSINRVKAGFVHTVLSLAEGHYRGKQIFWKKWEWNMFEIGIWEICCQYIATYM